MATTREIHVATVTDNNDPEKRFRVKVACATIMGVDADGEAVEFGDWVEPTFPALLTSKGGDSVAGGFFMVPNAGAVVELELSVASNFDESPGQTIISNPDPRWRASLFQEADEIPEEFAKNYPNRFGFRSATGHAFYFDDTAGDEGKITLAVRPNADGVQSFISLEDNGSIQIVASNGMMIHLNAKAGELTVLGANKNMIAMKPDGVTVMSSQGHTIDMNDSGVNILAAGNLLLQGNSITLKVGPGGKIALGDELAASIPTNAVLTGLTGPAGVPSPRVFASLLP